MSRRPPQLELGVEEHLNLSEFTVGGTFIMRELQVTDPYQGKFEVTDFIGSISEKLIAQSKADNGRKSSLHFISRLRPTMEQHLTPYLSLALSKPQWTSLLLSVKMYRRRRNKQKRVSEYPNGNTQRKWQN